MRELKRRDFLKMVGLAVVCPTQLLGKSNVLSDSDWQVIHINISRAIKEKIRLSKIISRKDAEQIHKSNSFLEGTDYEGIELKISNSNKGIKI